MADIDASIYRAIPAPQDPTTAASNTIGLVNAFTNSQILKAQNQQLQGGLQGQAQYGKALMDAGGDPAKAQNLFIQRGGNPLYATQGLQAGANLQGTQISNTNAAAGGNQNQASDALAAANSIAAGNGSRNEIVSELNKRLHNGMLTPGAYHSIVDGMPPDDKGASTYIRTKTAGMTPSATQAAPAVVGYDPNNLTPKYKTTADVNAKAASPGGLSNVVPPPGATEVASGDRKALFEDQLKASNTMGNVRPLQQALPLIQQLSNSNFGPGSPELTKIKASLATAGIIDPNTSDVSVRQEVGKYLLRYAKGAQDAGRSDQALSAAVASNPNADSMVQPATLALVKNQIGLDRMDAAMPKVFGSDAKPGQPYSEYKSSYYQANDPRAFSFDLMSPDERAKVKQSLGASDSPAYKKFVHSYQLAKQAGLLQPGGQQ